MNPTPFTDTEKDTLIQHGWEIDAPWRAAKMWYELEPYDGMFMLRIWMMDDEICHGGYWESDTYETLAEILRITNRT